MQKHPFKSEGVRQELPVGGYIPQSFIDYPGLIAAVIFTVGCNFRCPYCHNPELVDPVRSGGNHQIPFHDVVRLVERNRSCLDAVVVTGGEPAMHESLPESLRTFRKLGLLVKLDTNGSYPDMIDLLLRERLVDCVALDIKAPLQSRRYEEVIGIPCSGAMMKCIERSCSLLLSSGIDVVFRSTLLKGIHASEDVDAMAAVSGNRLILQRFRPDRTLRPLAAGVFSDAELHALASRFNCVICSFGL